MRGLIVVAAIAVVAWTYSEYFAASPFDATVWKNIATERYKMVDELEKDILHVGMTGEDVCDLLGPDEHGHCGEFPPVRFGHSWYIGYGPATLIPIRIPVLNTESTYLTVEFDERNTLRVWGRTLDD